MQKASERDGKVCNAIKRHRRCGHAGALHISIQCFTFNKHRSRARSVGPGRAVAGLLVTDATLLQGVLHPSDQRPKTPFKAQEDLISNRRRPTLIHSDPRTTSWRSRIQRCPKEQGRRELASAQKASNRISITDYQRRPTSSTARRADIGLRPRRRN